MRRRGSVRGADGKELVKMRHEAVIDGTLVSWLQRGDEPVLYVHGVPDSAELWTPFLERTGGIAVDLPGFGRSGKSAAWPYSLEGYAAFLPAFLDHLGLDRVSVVAHDWGGVALTLGAADRAAGGDRHAAPAPRPPLAVDRPRLAHAGGGRAGHGLHGPHDAAPGRRAVGRARRPDPAPLRPRDPEGDPQALPLGARERGGARRGHGAGAGAVGRARPVSGTRMGGPDRGRAGRRDEGRAGARGGPLALARPIRNPANSARSLAVVRLPDRKPSPLRGI